MTDVATALGFSADARVLIPHIDDVGVSHGANQAFVELSDKGFVTTGSVMVPCPWFPEAIDLAAAQPALDLGVHLTLTSESKDCRWRPITTSSKASGLLDDDGYLWPDDGYLWPDVPSVRQHADPGAVEVELRAPLDAALAAGLDVTHIDHHMGAAIAPEFAQISLGLAREYRLPILFPRQLEFYTADLDMGPFDPAVFAPLLAELEAEGLLVVDAFAMGLGMRDRPCEAVYRQIVDEAASGVTFLSLHCDAPGAVEHIHPNDAAFRIDEYRLFQNPDFLAWVADQDVHLTGFRAIRDHLRATA